MSDVLNALLKVQAEVSTLPKDKDNPFFKSKYTPLDTIVEIVGPLLVKNGLVWTTCPCTENGEPALLYRLAHAETGEAITGTMPLLLSKNDPQGLGSAITYARRYSICAVLNLVADEDDDGNKASARGKKTERPATLADQLRGKKKGAEIKKFVTDEFGATLDDVGVTADDLIKYLNGLPAARQQAILAWANG